MSQFMLLLHNDPTGWPKLSPEEMQQAMEKYIAWTQKSFVRGSQRLGIDVGRVMRSENGQTRVADGPYSETKEVLGGYYVVEAADYDAVVKLALDHPHLLYGGTIEVRKVWED